MYKQKVKHLLYEHQNNLTELKAEGTVAMKLAQKDHRSQETELRKDMRTLKVELKEQELANEMVVKNLRLVSPLPRGAPLPGPLRSKPALPLQPPAFARAVTKQRCRLNRNSKKT